MTKVLDNLKLTAMLTSMDEVTARLCLLNKLEGDLFVANINNDIEQYAKVFDLYWAVMSIPDYKLSDKMHDITLDCKYAMYIGTETYFSSDVYELLEYAGAHAAVGSYTIEQLF